AACDRHATGEGRLALITVDERGVEASYTFEELKDLSDRLAAVLSEMGVGRGDRVAVLLPQRVETALAHLAAFQLGAISVPLSPLFRADALSYRLAHSGAKVVVTDAEHRPHLGAAGHAVRVLDADDELWRLARAAAPRACVETLADDPAMLIYTSGTT